MLALAAYRLGRTVVSVRSCQYDGPNNGVAGGRIRAAERGSADELKWVEVAARTEASGCRWRFEALQRKLFATIGEVKAARRAVRDTLALRARLVSGCTGFSRTPTARPAGPAPCLYRLDRMVTNGYHRPPPLQEPMPAGRHHV